MCKCTPNIRTPFCGKPGCEWPSTKPEGAQMNEQRPSKEKVSEERLRNTRAWAARRIGQLSGAEVIVEAITELLQMRKDWAEIDKGAEEFAADSAHEPPAAHGMPTVELLDRMFAGDDLPPGSGDILYCDVTKEQWLSAKAELIARRHGLTAEQVSNARESLLNAVAERVRASQPPPATPLTWETFWKKVRESNWNPSPDDLRKILNKQIVHGAGPEIPSCIPASEPPEESLAQYLKDGETPDQCIKRNRADVSAALGLLAESKNNLAQAIRLLHVWRSWAVTPGNEPDPARADILHPLKNGRGELWKEVDTLLSKYPYTSPTKAETPGEESARG